ncbi:MAG: efflux RND transporter periplasmic adaptor subunit [Candidatus Sumerlaeia bacterium]|nr:efflux RND transporter periplasmic adaptor subunit [Candidatus Sumerlaeia bacterium]
MIFSRIFRSTVGFAGLLVLSAHLVGCGREPEVEVSPRPVRVMEVGPVEQLASRTFPGRAEATRTVTLSARVGGPLQELPIRLGQRVEEGDLIARIDPRDFETELRMATNALGEAEATLRAMRAGARPEEVRTLEARLRSANASLTESRQAFERTRTLFEEDVVSRAELESAETRLQQAESAVTELEESLEMARSGARPEDVDAVESRVASLQARVDAAQAALVDAEIRAPFSGNIAEKYVENFQVIRPQQVIATIQDYSMIEVRFGVPEVAIIRAGYVTGIICRFEAFPDREFQAEVKEIGTSSSPSTQSYPVTVIMPNPPDLEILPGMTVSVEIQATLPEESPFIGVLVPLSALISDEGGGSAIWIYDEETGTVLRRPVGVGTLRPEGILITDGLEQGDLIVTAGASFLHEHQNVRRMAEAFTE